MQAPKCDANPGRESRVLQEYGEEDGGDQNGSVAAFPVIAGLDPAIHADAMSGYWFYLMTSGPSGTLYAGVTNDLVRRVYEHKERTVGGFTSRYGVKKLVYYECYDTVGAAIQREKNVKHWSRKWKIELIQKMNPEWRDLYDEISI